MKKMKRFLAAALAAVTLAISFAGCGNKSEYISFDEVYSSLTGGIDFSASKMQKQGEAALNNYYYIDPTTLENYAIYMADYATGNADEIAMFQVKESDQVTVVKSLINDRIKDLKVRYEDYKPEEMTKLDSAIISLWSFRRITKRQKRFSKKPSSNKDKRAWGRCFPCACCSFTKNTASL